MDKLYAAPMEGLTGYLWRQVHAELFGPADKYFTPFLSPNATCTFQRKELDEIDPEHNRGLNVVPQLLTNRAEHFLWAARELHDRGFREVNFNLGCPAGTVAAKRKGAGLLAYPQELDRCLEEIFAGLPRGMTVSVKTRIGKNDPGEWPGLLEIYRRYPLAELIVHPRLQKEFYKGTPHREAFSTVSGPWPVVYNGDIWTAEDAAALSRDFPGTDAVMLGRGLMRDPSLLRQLRGGPAASVREAALRRSAGDAPDVGAVDVPGRRVRRGGAVSQADAQGEEFIGISGRGGRTAPGAAAGIQQGGMTMRLLIAEDEVDLAEALTVF